MTIQLWLQWLVSIFKARHVASIKNPAIQEYVEPPVDNVSQDWSKYLSLPYRTQWISQGGWDEDNCATRAAIECLEAILNYYLMNNLFPPLTTDFLKKNFCNSQGYVKLSIRYNATLNNTTPSGVSVDTVWNNFGIYGIVPESLYPDPATPFTWNDYYAPVPDSVVAFGKQTLTLFTIIWQVIENNNWNVPNVPELQKALITSPVYFAGSLWTTDANGIQQWNGLKVYKHCRLIYGITDYLEILDSYASNYLEKSSLSFPIPCSVKCAIKINT